MSEAPSAPDAPRFYVANPGDARRVVLPRDESRHALRVLRLRHGDPVVLFDGTNREHRGRLEGEDEGRATIAIDATEVVDREPAVAVTLAVGVPKGSGLEDLVRAVAELGARAVWPFTSRRTVVRERPGRTGRIDRARRASVEASKQCGRNRVTEVQDPCPFENVLARTAAFDAALLPTTAEGTVPLADAVRSGATTVLVAVGPEGGFAPEEIEAAREAGWTPVTLGRSRLRVATAAIAAVARLVAHNR